MRKKALKTLFFVLQMMKFFILIQFQLVMHAQVYVNQLRILKSCNLMRRLRDSRKMFRFLKISSKSNFYYSNWTETLDKFNFVKCDSITYSIFFCTFC